MNTANLIALSRMIKPQIKIQLFRHPVTPHCGLEERAYFFNTSKAFNDYLATAKMFELERVGDMNYLWRANSTTFSAIQMRCCPPIHSADHQMPRQNARPQSAFHFADLL
jgi:hypothetical protein